MTKKGFEVLKSLVERKLDFAISRVVVGADKNIENDFANEIIQVCNTSNIIYKLRNEFFHETSDYAIAISWRWFIPNKNSKLIVLHDSLLPRYRGFSPLVNMLCNKEKEIGVTAIFASDEYDKGDIIAQSSTKISYPIKVSCAIDLVSKNYVDLVLKIFSTLLEGGEIIAMQQDEEVASYSLWRDASDYTIDWRRDSEDVLNFINAVSSPYEGAVTYMNGRCKVRILDAELEADVKIENRDVGKVIFFKGKYPVIVCGSGLIKLLKVVDDKTREDLLPLKRHRIKLTGLPE